MKEARAVADGGRRAELVAQCDPQPPQCAVRVGARREVGVDGHVPSVFDSVDDRSQRIGGGGRLGQSRSLSGGTKGVDRPACEILGRLHVWLIERVDAEEVRGDGRRQLPLVELLAEIVGVGQLDAHQRPARGRERSHRCVVGRVSGEPQVDEQAIVRVRLGRSRRFIDHR